MKFLLSLLLLIAFFSGQGQDTLRLMHYNLLMYGNDFGGCNSVNNNVEDKNEYLKTIVEWVKPDILTVNEIYREDYYHDLLLNGVFNVNGVNYFSRGYPPNNSNSYIVNNVFFDTRKVNLESSAAVQNSVRDIDIFKFRYVEGTYADSNVMLNCAVAHLKAGNSNSDRQTRANETNNLMLYLNNGGATGNYMLSGDFNVYTAAESAFQNLLFYPNEDIRFYDPVSRLGDWNNNSNFSDVHTQSTHTSSGCFSGGGLDDRFDFILVSDEVLTGSHKIRIAGNSYHAVGQDGQHFNSTIVSSPENSSAPAEVISALFTMSDHLPVVIDLVIGGSTGISEKRFNSFRVSHNNPVYDELLLNIDLQSPDQFQISIVDIVGRIVINKEVSLEKSNKLVLSTGDLDKGIYLLQIVSASGNSFSSKLILK